MRQVRPVSPGEMLEEEFLKPLGLSKVSVSAWHLEWRSADANDRVRQEVRWTRCQKRDRYCGDGTARR